MKFDRKSAIEKLEKVGANRPCHRCGERSFSVLDELTNFSIQKGLTGVRLGGDAVPAALVICNNCGAITPHALGALNLLPGKEVKKDE